MSDTTSLTAILTAFGIATSTPAPAADNDVPCLNKAQARAKWPTGWLYWHGSNHCWDNVPGRSHSVRKPVRASEPHSVSQPHPSSAPKHVSQPSPTSVPTADSNPSPPSVREVIYPTLRNILGVGPEMLTAREITQWPLLIDLDEMFERPLAPDPNSGIDGCCWPKLENQNEQEKPDQKHATDHLYQAGKGDRWRR